MTDSIDGAAPLKDACVKKRRCSRKLVAPAPEVVERLDGMFPRELLEEALQGLEAEEITRPGGLITQLAGRVVEAALAAELTAHLGHPPGGVPAAGNVRNGGTAKTLADGPGAGRDQHPTRRRGDVRAAAGA
jgi:putative transposase